MSLPFKGNELKKDDVELVRKAKSGDSKAYDKLILLYKDVVYSIVYRMVRNKQEAEDLTQEAFIKAYKSINSFNEEYAFSTWLFKIATNNCIDFFRKRKLKTYSMDESIKYKDDEIKQEYADPEPDVEFDLVAEERKSIIRTAIDQLPEKYRIVIEMRHQKEYSYEQISEDLDLPLGTVKARIFRAREMLNKSLRGKLF
ncbi:MAG: sigma-70 family RNA polymerase sigma factor [Calditrichaeota bacterium]|nr:MAG: RNA polymerase subunit sigma-24 [Calditrichota bacterium]MBL1208078.1 sigma-70 family RNA polymerase sigma factor [Calditrichota bacterium]NOG47916.1 sigma-70 family RNA polymerase sigma factor [Calditrichota bacterium]